MKTGSNRNINKAKAKSCSPVTMSETYSIKSPDDKSIKDCPVT